MKSQNAEILKLMILKNFVFHLMEFVKKKMYPNCGDFIPSYSGRKCISKGNECEEVIKECEDFNFYYPHSDEIRKLEAKYVQKEDKSGELLFFKI